jgi:uncharacterized phage-like protein YoqJ
MLNYGEKGSTCCFTGHRPQKLHQEEKEVREGLEAAVRQAYTDGYRCFISGMAMGVDLWAGEAVIKLKSLYPDVLLIAAIPYPGQEKHFPREWKEMYAEVLSGCDHAEILSEEYRKGVFALRDRWMVDHSSRIIAVYNGEPGGTALTIAYAKREGLELKGI